MAHDFVKVTFWSPQHLTYGPTWDDGFSSIIGSMRSSTGGYMNKELAHQDDATGTWSYSVNLGVPEMAVALLEVAPDKFRELLLDAYYIEKYELSDIRIEAK